MCSCALLRVEGVDEAEELAKTIRGLCFQPLFCGVPLSHLRIKV